MIQKSESQTFAIKAKKIQRTKIYVSACVSIFSQVGSQSPAECLEGNSGSCFREARQGVSLVIIVI